MFHRFVCIIFLYILACIYPKGVVSLSFRLSPESWLLFNVGGWPRHVLARACRFLRRLSESSRSRHGLKLSFVCPSMVRHSPCFSYFRIQRAHFPGSRETLEMLLLLAKPVLLTWYNYYHVCFPFLTLTMATR